jgi:hypothetical protein
MMNPAGHASSRVFAVGDEASVMARRTPAELAANAAARRAARLVMGASLSLAHETTGDSSRYRSVAVSLANALAARRNRHGILAASPYVVERSGRVRTLVEMIEHEVGNDAALIRLSRLLLRALDWELPNRR